MITIIQCGHDRKFTVDELRKILGGESDTRYHHTEKVGNNNVHMFTITRELSGVPKEEYPEYNVLASKLYGRDIYGTCIFAPESAIK